MNHAPSERLRNAATVLAETLARTSPTPWTYYEDHGRDYTDEGWSHIGLLDDEGQHVGYTHAPGYEGNEQPEHDAALIVLLSGVGPSLIAAMRAAAIRYDAEGQADVDAGLLDVADAILARGVVTQ